MASNAARACDGGEPEEHKCDKPTRKKDLIVAYVLIFAELCSAPLALL